MEYRDLYDEFGNLTNEVILKGETYPSNRRILVAAIVIENDDKKLLIQKRSKLKDGLWSFTSGHIETKETSIDGIVRETKEEIGINLESENITIFNSGINDKYIFDLYYIKKNIDLSILKLQQDEVEEVRWLSLNDVKDLIKNRKFKESHINIFLEYLKYLDNICY